VSSKTTTPPSRPFARGKRGILVALTTLAGLSALGAAGCEATFTPGPLATSWEVGATWAAEDVPNDITSYPHVWYEGRWIYLVDGIWYAPTRHGWIVLREETPDLSRYRRYYEPDSSPRYAPTAPRERGRYRTY
jgi:hypothetical protein